MRVSTTATWARYVIAACLFSAPSGVWAQGIESVPASESSDEGVSDVQDESLGESSPAQPESVDTPPLGNEAPAADNAAEESGAGEEPRTIRYFLERVDVHGNSRTGSATIRRFVPLERGEVLDVDDPAIETIRWRLLGTGWFNDVRLRLTRGRERGWVVLVIEVEERNTVVIDGITFGVAEGVRTSTDTTASLEPYLGISAADTNLLGTGITLAGAVVVSAPQQGFRLRFSDPMFRGSGFGLSSSVFFNNAREFFGDDDALVSIRCPPDPDPTDGEVPECPPEVMARNAVVKYRRYGASIGTGHDMGSTTRYTLDWQAELVDVIVKPDAASEIRGSGRLSEVVPIDFAIDDGKSIVSTIQLGFIFDRRDDPALPTRGTFVQFRGELGSRLLLGDYDFLRMQVIGRQWVPLPWGHVLRVSGYAGVVFGRAPFFYHFYAADLSDLIPSRALEMNLDRRGPPNLLRTSIGEARTGEIAARLDVEYSIPLSRGGAAVRAVDAYANFGVYALANRRDVTVAIPGYTGFSRIPIDLTFDLGLRADTSIGVFQLGFSNVFGFIRP